MLRNVWCGAAGWGYVWLLPLLLLLSMLQPLLLHLIPTPHPHTCCWARHVGSALPASSYVCADTPPCCLPPVAPQLKQAISYALAQSTKLSLYEQRVMDLVLRTRHLPEVSPEGAGQRGPAASMEQLTMYRDNHG